VQTPEKLHTDADSYFTYLVALLLLAVASYYPLIHTGNVTFDDLNTAVNYGNDSIWAVAVDASKNQGRFTFLWGYPLLQVPQLIDSIYWHAATKIAAFGILLISLGAAVFQIFRSCWLVIAGCALFLSFQQNGWDHNAMTAYPFAFNAYASGFLLALAAFTKSIREDRIGLAWLAVLLYFFALGIELFIFFFPVFLVLASTVPTGRFEPLVNLKKTRLQVLIQLAGVVAYLCCYVLWRKVFPSNYDGNQLHFGDLGAVARVVWTYSINAFPIYSIEFISQESHRSYLTGVSALRAILENIPSSSWMKALCSGALIFGLLRSQRAAEISRSALLLGLAVSAIAIFLPNLLLGFVERHQIWVAGHVRSYLYTYYSFIACCVLLALLLALLAQQTRNFRPALRAFIHLCLSACVMTLTLVVDARNTYIAIDQTLAQRKFDLLEQAIKTPEFKSVPDHSTLLIDTLLDNRRGIAVTTEKFWIEHFKKKTGKTLKVSRAGCDPAQPCHSLVFRQASQQDDQYLVFSKLDNPTQTRTANLQIFMFPAATGMLIASEFEPDAEAPPAIKLNGRLLKNLQPNGFTQHFQHSRIAGPVQYLKINSNVALDPKKLIISKFNFQPGI